MPGAGEGSGLIGSEIPLPTSLGIEPAFLQLRSSTRKAAAGCSGRQTPKWTACSSWLGHDLQ